MGGKARRRREKNYLNAHGGGDSRLPPPPDFSTLDAVPSKLRKLMSLTGVKQANNGAKKQKVDAGVKKSNNGAEKQKVDTEKRQRSEDELGVVDANDRRGDDDGELVGGDFDHVDENVNDGTYEKKKKKRKRKQVDDLRFEALDKLAGGGSKRKERRKIRNSEKKKKRKGITGQENVDFLDRDDVKFGDVVQAPPKLVVPKTFKISKDACQERQRIQAVEAYRKRKAWTSRPGLQLNPAFSTDPLV